MPRYIICTLINQEISCESSHEDLDSAQLSLMALENQIVRSLNEKYFSKEGHVRESLKGQEGIPNGHYSVITHVDELPVVVVYLKRTITVKGWMSYSDENQSELIMKLVVRPVKSDLLVSIPPPPAESGFVAPEPDIRISYLDELKDVLKERHTLSVDDIESEILAYKHAES